MPKLKKINIENYPENHFDTDNTNYTNELEKKSRIKNKLKKDYTDKN